VPQSYDLMLLLDPNAPDERREQILDDVRNRISGGGEIIGEHDWGTRRMAFEIDKREDADYRLFQFSAANDVLEALRHSLRITDGVLRFRIIRLKPGTPPPPPPRDSSPRQREDREPEGRVAARAAADAPPA